MNTQPVEHDIRQLREMGINPTGLPRALEDMVMHPVEQPSELVAHAAIDHMLDAGLDQQGAWHYSGHSLNGLRLDIADYQSRRRRITPEAGHALEILGHAIEYLTDQFVVRREFDEGDILGVHLLMVINRKVYFACPFRSTFCEWAGGVIDRLTQKWGLPW